MHVVVIDIDVAGVKPLVNQREIHCVRPGNLRPNAGKPTYKSQVSSNNSGDGNWK